MAAARSSARVYLCLALAVLLALPSAAPAQEGPPDLTELSLEELMNITVTLVSKRAQRIADAAAAVYVITNEDLVRSGARNIPEALRMVPGMQVAQIDANKWAISARGFNGRFANKLLVLIDGRSVYTPVFSGVQWDVQDLPLQDVHQIEVIRGPGAALWGANAVNGVINIITKQAGDLKGGSLLAIGGTSGTGTGVLRYGGTISDELAYRAFVKGSTHGAYERATAPAHDGWQTAGAGVRMDWTPSPEETYTLQSHAYTGDRNSTVTVPMLFSPFQRVVQDNITVHGGHLLGRWTRYMSDESDLRIQFYVDYTERADVLHHERRTTVDLDAQYGFRLGESHYLVAGGGQRFSADRIDPSFSVAFDPVKRTDPLTSVFVQDEIDLYKRSLFLTLGTKVEHNSYTGTEVQPNARLLWNVDSSWTLWTAVSRAARTPSRAEETVNFVLASVSGVSIRVLGNPDFKSEYLTAYEAGVRYSPSNSLSIEVAGYHNDYTTLRTVEPTAIPLLLQFSNLLSGSTSGLESNVTLRPAPWWKLATGYSLFTSRFSLASGSMDQSGGLQTGGDSPRHQFHIRSFANVAPSLEADLILYYVSSLTNQSAPEYWRVDPRISWHVSRNLTLTGLARNLFDEKHAEFGTSPLNEIATQVPRMFLLQAEWRF